MKTSIIIGLLTLFYLVGCGGNNNDTTTESGNILPTTGIITTSTINEDAMNINNPSYSTVRGR